MPTRLAGAVSIMLAAASVVVASPIRSSPVAHVDAAERGAPLTAAALASRDATDATGSTDVAATGASRVHPRTVPAPRAGEADPRGARTGRAPSAAPAPELLVAPGRSARAGSGPLRTFLVEVDAATGVDPAAFAAAVERTLFDPRSWTAGGRYTFQRVDDASADFRVTLAPPDVVDHLCAPLDTRGTYSCWNEQRAVINHWRWRVGAEAYGQDLAAYRRYLVNHEVGHALGRGHVGCPDEGATAPVMMQQTVSVGACVPGPWPFPDG